MTTKKEVINYLINQIDSAMPLSFKKHKKGTTTIYSFENGCKVEFIFDSVLGGSRGKGSYVLTSTMTICNPFLAELVNKPLGKEPVNDGQIACLNHRYHFPEEWDKYDRFRFYGNEDDITIAERTFNDIATYFIPHILPFVKDYKLLFSNYHDWNFVQKIWRWNQFKLGIVVALINNEESFIEEILLPMAQNNPSKNHFLDFKNTENWKENLLLPIQKYLREQNSMNIHTGL